MSIIRELARDSVKKDRKSSIAVSVSIFIAVVLIGFFLIVFSLIDYGQVAYMTETTGGYSAMLLARSPEDMAELKVDHRVKRLAVIQREELEDTSLKRPKNEINYLDAHLYNYEWVELVSGRYPENSNELLVSELFLIENPGFGIGSDTTIGDRHFQISGTFKEYLFSFEGTYTSFGWIDTAKTEVTGPVDLCIWLENERGTYKQIPDLVQKLGLDPVKLKKDGGLIYNTAYLESKMIFPGGILKPSMDVAENMLLRGSVLLCLVVLFVMIIYNAFSVWNERDMKQIGLLKSCGMSKRQVKRYVVYKAIRLSLRPILLGIAASYLLTFLLFYLFEMTHIKYHIAYTPMEILKTPFIPLIRAALPVLCLALLAVILASLKPARRSSELSVVNVIKNLDPERSLKLKDIRYTSNIERSLAKEYSSSYGKSYRGMSIALAVACLICSMVLVVRSFNHLNERYNTYKSPYNINAIFVSLENVDPELLTRLRQVDGITQSVLYRDNWSLKFYESDNPDFLSEEKSRARSRLKEGNKAFDVPVNLYGIDDAKWGSYCDEHDLDSGSRKSKGRYQVLLLDRTVEDPGRRPYLRSSRIPLAGEAITDICLRREAHPETGLISLEIVDRLTEVPFGIDPMPQRSISLFMPLSCFNSFLQDNGFDRPLEGRKYIFSITANEDMLDEITRVTRQTVYEYIPRSDARVSSSNDIKRLFQEEEANIKILFIFIQSFLLFVGLSNAYNSFNSNLQARRRDFALLRSIGMQGHQLKKMLLYEGGFLLRKVLLIFSVLLMALVTLYAYRKKMLFAPWEIFANLNFPVLFAFLSINAIGIFAAIQGGIDRVLKQDIMESLREN
jgi:putative ABC transport system permease protein